MRAPEAGVAGMKTPAIAVSPLDTIEAVATCVEAGLFNVAVAMADLPADLWRTLPNGPEALLAGAGPAAVLATAVVVTFVVMRRLLRRWRRNADAEPNALVGLLERAGLEFLAFAAATVVCRVLLVRVLGIAHGAPNFSA